MRKIGVFFCVLTLVLFTALLFYNSRTNRDNIRWETIRKEAVQIPGSGKENHLQEILFLTDIYLDYKNLEREQKVINKIRRIKPSSISIFKGNIKKEKSKILAAGKDVMFGLWGTRNLIRRQGLDIFKMTITADKNIQVYAYEVYKKISAQKFNADVLARLQKKNAKFSFMAEIPGNQEKQTITVSLSNYSVKTKREIYGIVLSIKSKTADNFNVQIEEISLQDSHSRINEFFPSADYFKFRKQWMKSVFIPGGSKISYTIKADRNFSIEGYLGALPGESPKYRINANGVTLLNKKIPVGLEYFSHTISPVQGKAELEFFVEGSRNLSGILGDFTFFYEKQHKKNIVLYLVDALRGDFGGVEETDFKDYFKKGAVFTNAYANSTWTGDSLPVLFSGKFRHSLIDSQLTHPNLQESEVLLSEYLKIKGYTTAAFISNSFLIKNNSLQGFDHIYLCWGDKRKIPLIPDEEEYKSIKYGNMEVYIKRFIEENQDKKLFIFIHTMEPHDPYELPESKRYYSKGLSPEVLKSVFNNFKTRLTNPTEEQINTLKALYKDEVLQSYRFFENITTHLENKTIINPNSMTILTADHGERFFEHKTWAHGKPDVYNEVLHIPLLIEARGFKAGEYQKNVQLADIYPTIMDWLGDDMIKELAGNSLLKYINKDSDIFKNRIIYADGTHFANQFCCIKENIKVIISEESTEVYNLEKDPEERQNLFGQIMFQELIQAARDFRNNLKTDRRRRKLVVTEEEMERLKSLGYIK
jgi:arylsulfatase A-like enzyme